MPLLAFVWGFIASIIPLIVVKVVAALGISLIVYQGIELVFDQVEAEIIGAFTAIPPQIMEMFALTGIGVAINSILSAMAAVLAYKVFSGAFNVFKFGGN